MILIVSSHDRERALFTAICDQQKWPCHMVSTVGEFPHALERTKARTVLLRHRLQDGYSDDIFALLRNSRHDPAPKVVVLMAPDTPPAAEARQVSIGADCVMRDPLRVDVLLAYLRKFRAQAEPAPTSVATTSFDFGGAQVFPHEHRAAVGDLSVHLSPQETNLLRLLSRMRGKVVPYPVMYAELFGRRFSGETANCRVLLGKTAGSFQRLGIDLRAHVQVIPKSGYLCVASSAATPGIAEPEEKPATRGRKSPRQSSRQ